MSVHEITILADTMTPAKFEHDEVMNAMIDQWVGEFTNLASSLHLIPSDGTVAVSLTMTQAGDVMLLIDVNGDNTLVNMIQSVHIAFPGQRVLDSIERMIACKEHEDSEKGTPE